MSRNKVVHRVLLNSHSSRPSQYDKKYVYDYGNTKSIAILLSKNRICISAELSRTHNQSEVLSPDSRVFSDAIRKALLCHLCLYSESIILKEMFVQIGKDIEPIEIPDVRLHPPICSMVFDKLHSYMSNGWSCPNTIQGVLQLSKASYDSRIASLFALICAKSKRFETERFIYLWMAFNGMYNYYAQLIRETSIVQQSKALKGKVSKECEQICLFQKLFDVGDDFITNKTDKRCIAQEVISVIQKANLSLTAGNVTKGIEIIENDIKNELYKRENKQLYAITAYGYLLTQFSYYFRCAVIHANRPILLFSYANDSERKCLQLINGLLEEFLDENLYKWFDQEYINSLLLPKAIEAAANL